MLRSYVLKYNKIFNIQKFVNHIFLDVVFNARKNSATEFSSDLLLPKYKYLIDSTNNKYLLDPLKEVYAICKKLEPSKIKFLKRAVHNNIKIRELCNKEISPVKYPEIDRINTLLSVKIKLICDSLYINCLNLTSFKQYFGDIDSYYKILVGRSATCKCCGFRRNFNQFNRPRGPFDHYLPKSIYPFISVNFKNLVPICNPCNSGYKLSTDTLELITIGLNKVKYYQITSAYYPYSRVNQSIEIFISFKQIYDPTITPEFIDLSFKFDNQEKGENWLRVFGIENQYKSTISETDYDNFVKYCHDTCINENWSVDKFIKLYEGNKDGDDNFLRIPFLKAVRQQKGTTLNQLA